MKQRSLIAAFLALASLASIAGQTFQMDQKAYVPFDASTTVSVECPDATAAAWLASHLKEWYGGSAPRVASGETGLTAEGDEGYAANVDASGVKIKANTVADGKVAIDTNQSDLTKANGKVYVLVGATPDAFTSGKATKLPASVGDTLSELVDIDAASDSKFFRVGVGYSAP